MTDYFASVPVDREGGVIAVEHHLRERRDEVRRAIARLSADPLREDVAPAVEACAAILRERPGAAADFTHGHGLMPVIELLQQAPMLPPARQAALLEPLLELCNLLAASGVRFVCENLCLLGAVPAAAAFVSGDGSTPEVRTLVARLMNAMCRAGPATLAMLVAADALPVLVMLLEPDRPACADQTLVTVDSLWCLFQMRSYRAPRSDFCRLLGAHGVLGRLVRALHLAAKAARAAERDGDPASEPADRVVQAAEILLLFSHADAAVAENMLLPDVLQDLVRAVQEGAGLPAHALLTLLKAIKNLSMGPPKHVDALQRAGAVTALVFFLDEVQDGQPFALEMRGQVMLALYHLCKLNRTRQEQAVVCPPSHGIVPHLQTAVLKGTQLKHVALPMLCDIARASKRSRAELWKHAGVGFYLDLLSQEAWRDDAIEALAAWLADEPRKARRGRVCGRVPREGAALTLPCPGPPAPPQVEPILSRPEAIRRFVDVLDTQTPLTFEKLLVSMNKILSNSSKVNQALGNSPFVAKLIERLQHPSSVIRSHLLRMLTSIYEHHRDPKKLMLDYDLRRVVRETLDNDPAVMAKGIAGQLYRALKANDYV